jgi:hypothetical protein
MLKRSVYLFTLALAIALAAAVASTNPVGAKGPKGDSYFQRIASFYTFMNTDIELETVAEIVAATPNGRTLVYTDAETESVGFVDIKDPANPLPLGALELAGEPTSVAVAAQFAYVATNTSENFIDTSGKLYVIHIPTLQIREEYELDGQPDSVALSRNGQYAAIVIENERDEDLGNGEPPQPPPGELKIFDVHKRSFRTVDLTGIADLFPDDPEPEYVDINDQNIAVVTLQENNHIVLVDLRTGQVTADFPAGAADLDQIDTIENALIELNSSLNAVPREPDAVTWISDTLFATADEGDLFGGSRGFTIFDTEGNIVYTSGNEVEHIAASLGHYPEDRSENKGSEPEGVDFGAYNSGDYLFVGTERASLVLVYSLDDDPADPQFVQALPGGIGPEGLLAIPHRNLFVAAAENDEPGGFRSVITIYSLQDGPPAYPTIASEYDGSTPPITWGALSGLAADLNDDATVYTVRDSFYVKSSFYDVDLTGAVPTIVNETFLMDDGGLLAAVDSELVNGDDTVNLDQEGIAVRADGGFWIASEGSGSVDDPNRPVETPNLLLRIDGAGVIQEVVTLPDTVNDRQRRFGFEGVTSVGSGDDEIVYVAFQREWFGDPDDHVRIGRYEVASGDWSFYYYPIEMPAVTGWVGLSEIVALDDETFAVVERDNQADVSAVIKRIYTFSINGLTPVADDGTNPPAFPLVAKSLAYDLLPDLQADGGIALDKVEGLAVLSDGTALAVTDNDGVDDSSGETQLLRIEGLFK